MEITLVLGRIAGTALNITNTTGLMVVSNAGSDVALPLGVEF
jgi:hypothetical protein